MISNNQSSKDLSASWSTRMSFVFGICALLGIILLIFSEVGFAQSGGFRPGGGPALGNPIGDPDFDEEDFDEDFEDMDEPPPPIRPRAGVRNNEPLPGKFEPPASEGGISVGGQSDDKPTAELKRTRGGFQLSGPGTEKGIKNKNPAPNMPVDTESGDGIPASKEMITDFNFPDADIMDIAKTLGKLTGKNFILDKDVKGRVSIISNSPITVSDAWRAFLTSLDMNALAIVPTGKYLRIMRQNDAKAKNVRLYSGSKAPNTDALVTKIFKIKYISAKELENVIRTYTSMGARIYGFEQTNTLIITDTGSNIDKVAKMIAFLDVEGFDAGIEVIPVKYASAVELQKLIDSLLPGTQANQPGRPNFGGGGARGGPAGFQARRTKQGGFVNTIIPDERTNTLIVHANPKGAEEVRELVSRLDRKLPQSAGGGKVHVVYLQFADAEEMAKTLSNFSQGAKTPTASSSFPGGPIGGIGLNPNEGNLFEGQIKVSADKTTNSLVITASPSDYVTLQRVINKLDIPRDQIYVEVQIMEMSMQRNSEYAANVLAGGSSVAPTTDLFDTIVNPAKMAGQKGLVLRWKDPKNPIRIPIPGASGGSSSTIEVPNIAALIKALETHSNANILATPQLMTMDNTEATFESSDKIPVPKVNNAGLGIQQISYESMTVPLTIKIKPQLNKISNFIKMEIKAKISDFSSREVTEGAPPATLERNAETSVMVSDGDTVVLGGLTRDKQTEAFSKVPLLGDIPILGWLFKAKNTRIEKTNLMLFITPKIMRQPENVRTVLDQKLKERDDFVERAFGGEDYHREARNKMIRGLPDVKKITNYNSKRILNTDDEDAVKDNSVDAAKNEGVVTETDDALTLPAAEPMPSNPPPNQPAAPESIPAVAPEPSGTDPFDPNSTALPPGGATTP